MSDPRFEKINELFINYSLGNFDFKVEVSSALDEVDAFISNVNMLGEELKATTISKNYFNTIFDSVSEMIFVLDNYGIIKNINKHVTSSLYFHLESLQEKQIDAVLKNGKNNLFNELKKEIEINGYVADVETIFISKKGKEVPVFCTLNYLPDKSGDTGYILIGRDITRQKEMENLVIRTIETTQENERKRFATDLHDSLGQQLSAIQFYLKTATSANKISDSKTGELLSKSIDALGKAIIELRQVCFNLMPKTLENFGLSYAIRELCKKVEIAGELEFSIFINERIPKLEKSLEIVLFRIVQEFINNSLKHADAKKISIDLHAVKNNLHMTLKDNGRGFDINKSGQEKGLGLKNVQTRVAAYFGDVKIASIPGKGTSFEITIPLK